MSTTTDPYMSVPNVVIATGFTEMWIRMMAKKGKIPGAVKMSDGRWMIPTTEVDKMRDRINTRQEHKQARAEGRAPKKHQTAFRVRAVRYILRCCAADPTMTPELYVQLEKLIRPYAGESQGALADPLDGREIGWPKA